MSHDSVIVYIRVAWGGKSSLCVFSAVQRFALPFPEVIGAMLSILGIWLLTAFLCYFSLNRLILNDFDINAHTMMLISGIGIGINVM